MRVKFLYKGKVHVHLIWLIYLFFIWNVLIQHLISWTFALFHFYYYIFLHSIFALFLHYYCFLAVLRCKILRWLLCCIPKCSAYVCTSASGWNWVYKRSDCQGNWMTLWWPWQQEHLQIVKTPVGGKAGILDLLGESYVKTRTVKLMCSFSTIIKNRKQKRMQCIIFYDLL